MNGMRSRIRPAWFLVVGFAAALWMVPVGVVRFLQDPRRGPRDAPPPPGAQETGPLILYAETWPTRDALDIDEIQGVSAESDVALAPATIASDLCLALSELGVVGETRRLTDPIAPEELLARHDIVVVYPARHGQPPWPVMAFIDHDIEGLVARTGGTAGSPRIRDIAIGETTPRAVAAQSVMAVAMAYYHLAYQPGPTLDEALNSFAIYDRLRHLATDLAPGGTQRTDPTHE